MTDTTLRPIADKMADLMPGTKVTFINNCVGDEARRGVDALQPGEVALLENLRYNDGEKKNDPDFAKELAALGDIYVDDAFSTAHRAHASVEAITHFIPSYAGLLMMAEIRATHAHAGTSKLAKFSLVLEPDANRGLRNVVMGLG